MSVAISITFNDEALPALEKKMAALTPARLAGKLGPACARITEEHLAALGPNAKGWPTTRFYEKFARNVRWFPDDDGVTVAILPAIVNGRQVGLAQRYFGGTITPKTAKALAIPISPVSYGKVPSDFQKLFLLKTGKGAYLVQAGESINPAGRVVKGAFPGARRSEARRRGAALNFLFKLVASVTQSGDPTVLPTDEEYLEVISRKLAEEWEGN
jgi:hypothetical protein